MPTPPKRAQRPRREVRSDVVVEDSSPSRPMKRRKKNDDAPADLPEEENSSLIADQSQVNEEDEGDRLVTRVTQHLQTSATPVQASTDHANSMHESHKEGVQAFAKIAAQDWTFYIKKLKVNIGRSSEPAGQHRPETAPDAEDAVHIDLGPSKTVSRQHALVYFNHDKEEWWLSVKGRNTLKVDGHPWKSGQEGPLSSGEVIEINGIEMMFVLPFDLSPLNIHDKYLERAGIIKSESPTTSHPTRHPLPPGDANPPPSSPPRKPSPGPSLVAQKPLAPAPPDYRRPGTPPSARPRTATAHTSPMVEHTPMSLGNIDMDLSLDENQQYKPQFSYAQMITQAIMDTEDEKLNLSGIYKFIMSRYAYYRHQPSGGWQNSIRHNLSLNRAFEKVARSTDEPGKGMKWQIVPDQREEMVRVAYRGGRGGHRGSSNPSSPSQLSYITQVPRDMAAARDPMSARKRKVSPSGSPQPRSAIRGSHLTPVRSSRKPLPDEAGAGTDGSPLPRLRKTNASSTLGLVENAPGSPTLTSSYLQDDSASFVTPAPHRVHPKLAPPSTAQRPSQHMPTSSPAPFWKYAEIGSTPLKPAQFDLSPSKAHGLPAPQSSSPPPARGKSPIVSPTRASRAVVNDPPSPAAEIEEDQAFDLTKGFQSIGSFHAPVSHGKQVEPPATNGGHAT
ncbi:fork head domain-containing protein [Podospora didyma]|uniref:Fork head domain-containing protein n=1 Tax=Podospora didyma TaxID=330526 RepID=A0AAE0KE34_9PEZI|nr:fork head domain-containing protein [Podospora didyma]